MFGDVRYVVVLSVVVVLWLLVGKGGGLRFGEKERGGARDVRVSRVFCCSELKRGWLGLIIDDDWSS